MSESKLAAVVPDIVAQAEQREMMPLIAKLIKDANATPTADEELLLKMPAVREMSLFLDELASGAPPTKIYGHILAYVNKRYGHLVGKAAASAKSKAKKAEKEEAAASNKAKVEEAKRALALQKEMEAEARREAKAKREAEAEAAADADREKEMEANLKEEAAREKARKKEAAAEKARKKAEKEEAAAEKALRKEEAAAEKAHRKEEAAAEKALRKEEAAAEKARKKEEAAAEKGDQEALDEDDEKEAKRKAKRAAKSVGDCIHCQGPITDKEYLALGDKKLHKKCRVNYEQFMKNKCEQCGGQLMSNYIEFGAKGAGWGVQLHEDCLTAYKEATRPNCAACGIKILDDKRLERKGKAYHVACTPEK